MDLHVFPIPIPPPTSLPIPSSFFLFKKYLSIWASLVAQIRKNLPAMQETRVWSLAGEDPLEKGVAIHSSILAWRTPWTERLAGHSPGGRRELDMTEWPTHTFLFMYVFTWLQQVLVAAHGIL